MYFEEPEEIVYNFLRYKVAEIERSGLENRYDEATQSFTGDGSTVEFYIDENIQAVKSVTVDGTTQIPFSAYNIDLDNNKIKFRTAPGDTLAIVVTYLVGSNWVFPDSPREDLSKDSYPRIGCWQISESTDPEEMGTQSNSYDTVLFQIDVVTHKDVMCLIDSEYKGGLNVTKYLARQIKNAFKDYAKTDLIYTILDFRIIENSPLPYQEDLNIYRRIVQVQITFRNLRRMIT